MPIKIGCLSYQPAIFDRLADLTRGVSINGSFMSAIASPDVKMLTLKENQSQDIPRYIIVSAAVERRSGGRQKITGGRVWRVDVGYSHARLCRGLPRACMSAVSIAPYSAFRCLSQSLTRGPVTATSTNDENFQRHLCL